MTLISVFRRKTLIVQTLAFFAFSCHGYSLDITMPQFPVPVDLRDAFRAPTYKLGGYDRADHLYLSEPFILMDDEEHVHVSNFLKFEQDALLRMIDLSYRLVRPSETQVRLTIAELEQLKATGWIITGFRGLEGRRNTYPDMSGLVCFHPKDHLIVVVYRGTAGNKDGWDTNFDATKTNARKVQKEFCKDLFDEVVELIKNSEVPRRLKAIKVVIREAQKDEPSYVCARNTFAKVQKVAEAENMDPDLTDDIFDAFRMKLELMAAVDKLGSEIEGEVHKGFLKKYLSTKREVLSLLKEHVKSLSKEDRRKLKIVFTGHSQAGATGNLALADICANHGQEIFGASFSNKKDSKFYGYFLSAARAGDKEYRKWVHEHVGHAFVVRQNVEGDPAPISAGDARMHNLVSQVPVVGEILSKRFTMYDDTGYLLLDDGHKVWKRARDLYEREGFDMNRFEEIEDLVRYVASWIVEDEEAVPKYLAPKGSSTSFLWSPIKWTRNRIHTAKTINLLRRALMGDQEAMKELEQFSEIVMTRYAHLHYGHFREDTGAAFDPAVVGRDLDAMADRGHVHEIKRKARMEKG